MAVPQLRFAVALLATNLKASLALRGAFWIQVVAMAANNALYFTTWWVFFHRYDEIGGWRIADMLGLFGVVAAGFGTCIVLAGGIRDLARTIAEGELDPFMTQPKSPMLHVVGSRSIPSGWGDLASGLLFVAVSGLVQPETLPLLAVAVCVSASVFVASGILLHSLAFWLGRVETLVRMMWEFLLTFSLYPQALFGGVLRFVLFTLVPAGLIGFLPVGLLRDFQWGGLAAALGGAAAYAILAAWVFRCGLRRYESGSRIGVRA